MADPQFTRGDTTDPMAPPKPQGQATAVNAMSSVDDDLQLSPEESALVGISGKPEQPAPNPTIDGDRRKLMFAPTDRPREPVNHGLTPGGRLKPPPDIMSWAPYLQEAASEPDAPDSVRALWEAIKMALAEG